MSFLETIRITKGIRELDEAFLPRGKDAEGREAPLDLREVVQKRVEQEGNRNQQGERAEVDIDFRPQAQADIVRECHGEDRGWWR